MRAAPLAAGGAVGDAAESPSKPACMSSAVKSSADFSPPAIVPSAVNDVWPLPATPSGSDGNP